MTKTTTKTTKIPFASWLKTKEGKSFLNICDSTRDVDDPVKEAECGCFGSNGWVTAWVEENNGDFPPVDKNMTDRQAFDRLWNALTNNAEDAAIILTFGPNYIDDRDNFAYSCLMAIAGVTDSPLPH